MVCIEQEKKKFFLVKKYFQLENVRSLHSASLIFRPLYQDLS